MLMFHWFILLVNHLKLFIKFFLFQAQFTFALPLGINAIHSGCKWPLWMKYLFVFYIITMLVLFGDFYKKNYIKKVCKIIIVLQF